MGIRKIRERSEVKVLQWCHRLQSVDINVDVSVYVNVIQQHKIPPGQTEEQPCTHKALYVYQRPRPRILNNKDFRCLRSAVNSASGFY